jgi:hypothetical protein
MAERNPGKSGAKKGKAALSIDDEDEVLEAAPRRTSSAPPMTGAIDARTRAGRERKEVQALLERGRNKGFLTYDELNDALPPEMVTSDQIDDLLLLLGSESIDVIDVQHAKATKNKEREEARNAKKGEDDDEDEADEPAPVRRPMTSSAPPPASLDDAMVTKSNDPVRMYLRKMGSVSLLTREGEVEIAKRIEQGELKVNSPPSSTRRSRCARSSISARSSRSTRSASRTSSRTPRPTIRSSTRRRRTAASSASSTRSSASTRRRRTLLEERKLERQGRRARKQIDAGDPRDERRAGEDARARCASTRRRSTRSSRS